MARGGGAPRAVNRCCPRRDPRGGSGQRPEVKDASRSPLCHPHAAQTTGLRLDRRLHPRPGDRRHISGLQFDSGCAADTTALPESGAARIDLVRSSRTGSDTPSAGLGGRAVAGMGGRGDVVRLRRRLSMDVQLLGVGRRQRIARGHVGQRGLFPGHRPRARDRPDLRGPRHRRGRGAGHHPRL